MKEFILILFFSKTVLLTPNFITIEDNDKDYIFRLKNPVSAITSGASVQIDVAKMISLQDKLDILVARDVISKIFPKGSIEASLATGNKTYKLVYDGGSLINNTEARLILTGSNVPIDVDFNSITIKTSVKLENVKVYWVNYKK